MAKGTFGIIVEWVDVAIGWVKKAVRHGQVENIDSAVSSHNDKRVNGIVQSIQDRRKKRTNAS